MKLNSPESIATAEKVFREYRGSWSAARDAAIRRDPDGVLVIPMAGASGSAANLNDAVRSFDDKVG